MFRVIVSSRVCLLESQAGVTVARSSNRQASPIQTSSSPSAPLSTHTHRRLRRPSAATMMTHPLAIDGGRGVDTLAGFESRCPSDGQRMTFKDCSTVCWLLNMLHITFQERDVSTHTPYWEKLRVLLPGQTAPCHCHSGCSRMPKHVDQVGHYYYREVVICRTQSCEIQKI
uniref:Uncharacterized protein n=2 Tax=Triticum urartu TaxID=4572 RepID=A0A8R7R2X4_TRIUA